MLVIRDRVINVVARYFHPILLGRTSCSTSRSTLRFLFLFNKMSLRKWQELAKRKSELGKKINFVHDAITKQKIGKETSEVSFEKPFKPITSKLDDVISAPLPRKIPRKSGQRPDYTIPAEDDDPDLDLGDLFKPQDKPPAKVTTFKGILGSPPVYEEEGYNDFPDYRVEGGRRQRPTRRSRN